MLRGELLVFGIAMSVAQPAYADHLTDAPTLDRQLQLSARIRANLNDYTNDFTLTLDAMTSGLLSMKFDLHRKVARVRLGGGDPDAFRLVVDNNVLMRSGQAQVQSRIDLAVAGHRLGFDVPRFDLGSESVGGERALQLSIPVFEGRF